MVANGTIFLDIYSAFSIGRRVGGALPIQGGAI